MVAAPHDDLMEDLENLSDQLGDCDHTNDDPATASAIMRCEEVLGEASWKNCKENSLEAPKEPEMGKEILEGVTNKDDLELVIQKLFMESAKVVIKMLE